MAAVEGKHGCRCPALQTSDLFQMMGEGDLVEASHRQREEGGDPVLQVLEGLDERPFLLDIRPLDRCGILDAPVGGSRMARPDRAGSRPRRCRRP